MPKKTKPQKAVITITDSEKGVRFGVIFTPTLKAKEPTTSPAIHLASACIEAVTKKIAEWQAKDADNG